MPQNRCVPDCTKPKVDVKGREKIFAAVRHFGIRCIGYGCTFSWRADVAPVAFLKEARHSVDIALD